MYKNDITHQEIPVSNKSQQVIVRALVAARRAGTITDEEYIMTYAEVCEPGRYPQAFGGGTMRTDTLERWTRAKSWQPVMYPVDAHPLPVKRVGW